MSHHPPRSHPPPRSLPSPRLLSPSSTQQPPQPVTGAMESATVRLAQLDLDVARLSSVSTAGGAQIDRLPNELLQLVLARVEMQNLILLELVCKRWQKVIYSIGQTKLSFYLSRFEPFGDDLYNYKLLRRFFGEIELDNFTGIRQAAICSNIRTQFLNRFSQVRTLALDLFLTNILSVVAQLPRNQIITLAISESILDVNWIEIEEHERLLEQLNLIVSLKRLRIEIRTLSGSQLPMETLSPTLARLEEFSYTWANVASIVPHLGQTCSRVSFGGLYRAFDCEPMGFYHWHHINGQWLSNVIQLELISVDRIDRAIHYLSKHAPSLQVLRLEGNDLSKLTSHVIGYLAKLEQLTELCLCQIAIELPKLVEDRRNLRLPGLVSLRTVVLDIEQIFGFDFTNVNQTQCDNLIAVLSTILPNVEHLAIRMTVNCYDHMGDIFDCLKSFLYRFTKLQSHCFEFL